LRVTPTLSLTEETRLQNALDDLTSNIWQALPRVVQRCQLAPVVGAGVKGLHGAQVLVAVVPARAHQHVAVLHRRQAQVQGLTLVHLSAQRKRFLSDRGAYRGCLGGV
jgi:hypothetical protein